MTSVRDFFLPILSSVKIQFNFLSLSAYGTAHQCLDVIYGDGILPCFRYLVMWPFPRLPGLPVAHLIPLPRRRYVVWLALGLSILTDPGYLVDIMTPV